MKRLSISSPDCTCIAKAALHWTDSSFYEMTHWTLYHKRHHHNLKTKCRGKIYWNFRSKAIILLTWITVLICSLKSSFESHISPKNTFISNIVYRKQRMMSFTSFTTKSNFVGWFHMISIKTHSVLKLIFHL